MKKNLFLAALAIVAFASCTSDDFVGDVTNPQDNSPSDVSNAIVFNSGAKGITRADHVGADAAGMLSNHFTVSGFKGDGSTRSTVFDNYIVNWTANTAATTESNTSDWEYVGITAAAPSTITGAQTIKYWDYSTSQYDFIAYSTGAKSATTGDAVSGTSIKVTAIDQTKLTSEAYKLTGASRADLAGCYIADMVTAYKADNPATYGKEVTFKFRNLASKVRMALYETVPGYSVKDVKFYTAHPSTLGTGSTTTAALIGTMNEAGTYTVKFPTIGSGSTADPDYNKAHVSFTSTSTSNYQTFGTLENQYVGKHDREAKGTKFLGITSTSPTFAGSASPFYETVLPNETGAVFELAIDYTLESTDGSKEEINVYGATAYIPLQFTKWLPNYAYTYIFKISDNSDGWTSTTNSDPKGLYPITFDAVVVDSEENTQSTITTVASPSITTYQKGHNYETDGPEYEPGDIYVQVMIDGTLKGDLNTKGQLYTLSADKTEAIVLDALNIQASSDATTITGRNGLVLTKATSDATITSIPGEDGNPISITAGEAAKFEATNNTYAYVYDTDTWNGIKCSLTAEPSGWPTGWYTDAACGTAATGTFSAGTYYKKEGYIYTAETMTSSAPSDWTTTDLWYKDPNGETAAGAWDESNNGKVFYKRYTANAKIYGVKVIKVQ